MKIMVIFTGGTIGSAVNDGFISPDNSQGYKLITEYEKISTRSNARQPVDLYTCMPYSLLSENLNGEYLNKLIECVKTNLNSEEQYDGIIITHGTDTLQYTAAAIDYVFADTNIPIVLVSSNYILDDERANGLSNFYFAIEFIKKEISGVYVSYRNVPEQLYIHYGSRLLPHMTCQDEIYSIGNSYLGCFKYASETGNFPNVFYSNTTNSEVKVSKNATELYPKSSLPEDICFSKNCPILYLKAMPGLIYPAIPDGTTAILIDSYHSGTICTESSELKSFTKQASSKNIPVFLVGAEDRTAYESTKIYSDLNINVLPKSSPIAIYVKLWLLSQLKLNMSELIEMTNVPISREFI